MAACRRCPIFDRRRKTCGNPRAKDPDLRWTNPETGKDEAMGCWCMMILKSRIANVTCWLHDQGVTDAGWPMELDGA